MHTLPTSLAPLHDHLAPHQVDLLLRDGDLPATMRAEVAASLRDQLTASAAFIPARIVRTQLAKPQPARVSGAFWEGSLLFADLSGFTVLSERLSVLGRQGAEEVTAVVSRLFDALIAEVHARQGMLLKFGGDALTAFFDADQLGLSHGAAAAAAALAMQQRMAAFANLQTRAGSFTLSLRVGVHSGRVFAAEVGDSAHIELVVTGPEVNRVALAQEIAAPGQVVVTNQTAALIPDVTLRGATNGFHLLTAMPEPWLPAPLPDPVTRNGPDDLATLVRLATELVALRPYLVRDLPRRFLEATEIGLGEFRPVSVLFANIHDFSAILDYLQHDPERAAAIFNAYYRRTQAVVHRYDGIVNKVDMYTHGDKLIALFGAPSAHEDDPTRAVRCALELRIALAEANLEVYDLLAAVAAPADPATPHQLTLAQKIGINTGTVFAGRVGGATRYEYTVMGSAVNLAARLMAAADDDEVLLSPSARAAVANQFELEDGRPLQLKGIAEPVTPARVLRFLGGATTREDGGSALMHSIPLIGREAELQSMLKAATAALNRRGRVLALIGEAGAGKSRLAEELIQRLIISSVTADSEPVPSFAMLISECQSYEQRTPYAALRGPLYSVLGLTAATTLDDPQSLAAQLGLGVLQLVPELERFAPLLADALGKQVADTPLTASLSPEQRHDRLQDLVVAVITAAAEREPLLILVEDAHWADLPSLDLIARLAAIADQFALVLLLTYRPEPPIAAPWDGLPLTHRLRLGELSAADSTTLLAALLEGDPPAAILPLLDRTQGNPFFIEELVRALIASGVLQRDDAGIWQVARNLDEVELPKSIEGLLMARLDRLDEPRQELVQVASVIGRRFQRPIVEGVYGGTVSLDESLQRLVSYELIQAEQLDRLLAYLFRHALLRDVAYEGILYARRRVLHGRVARRIEELGGTNLDDRLAILAWHYLQAEELEPALDYHLRAADQAARRFANRDALALYATALTVAQRLADQEMRGARDAVQALIHERSGELRLLLGEYDEAESHLRAALERSPLASEGWLRLHRLLASLEERRSRYDEAFSWLRTGLARATAAQREETARSYLLGAGIYYRQGEYQRALEWARMGLRLAEEVDSQADQAHALKLIGNVYAEQSDLSAAIQALQQARELFDALNLPSGLCDTLNDLGVLALQLGRWAETITSYEQSLQISEAIGDVQAVARTSNNLAVVLVGRDQLERAGALYQHSSAMFGRIGSALGVAVTTYNRGEVLLLQERPVEAQYLFSEALTSLEQIGARAFLPDALRLAAEAALDLGDLELATTYATRSLVVAEELGMALEQAVARRTLGQIALTAQDLRTAALQLDQSSVAFTELASRYDLGKTRYQQARLALAANDPVAFANAKAEAIAIFTELDAPRDLTLALDL
ncbi:MAG: adenylate/guanylate cyclase domain-containing protein [Oscillochloridaceae bacterium umkhey_bin13]